MVTMTFDTHSLVKELTEVGMPEPQAELLAHNHARLLDRELFTKDDLKQFATKEDLGGFATKEDIKELRRDMKELALRLTHQLTQRVGYMLTLAVGVMVALVTLS